MCSNADGMTLSASGAAITNDAGVTRSATISIAENTRPCSSSGTLTCQIVMIDAFAIVISAAIVKSIAANEYASRENP